MPARSRATAGARPSAGSRTRGTPVEGGQLEGGPRGSWRSAPPWRGAPRVPVARVLPGPAAAAADPGGPDRPRARGGTDPGPGGRLGLEAIPLVGGPHLGRELRDRGVLLL